MKVLNYGSLNIDIVYQVDHIAAPGETILSASMNRFPGGKGLNQSIALARAGLEVYHAGMIGKDGAWLLDICQENGVDTRYVSVCDTPTGNAIIQVSASGENSIVLYGGANQCNDIDMIERVMADFGGGDCLLLQNEINLTDVIINRAHDKGMMIAFNPAPINKSVRNCDLSIVDILLINEVECIQISGEVEYKRAIEVLHKRYPGVKLVLTLGKAGVVYKDANESLSHGIYDVPVVDTTGAGDTFIGFYIAAILRGELMSEAIHQATLAASLSVSRQGAAGSIPSLEEILQNSLTPCEGAPPIL